ncbi:MAG: hypothetical protein K2J04_14335 [Lachnospiraceae bacterium]|nr:hypothetical protein [Lachnospiraceae bacterium]
MIKMITLCITAILVSTLPAHTDSTEQSHSAPATLVSEQNYDTGAPVIEKCYDDPDNPVATQDYSVGEPNIE